MSCSNEKPLSTPCCADMKPFDMTKYLNAVMHNRYFKEHVKGNKLQVKRLKK